MYPEIGFEVQRTAGIAAAELKKLGLVVREGVGQSGVIGDLDIPGATTRIALRADMDALPMQEEGNPPYKSRIDGKAHMCGHDAHTAMLIGAARVINDLKEQLQTSVRFIFQPSEEKLPGGAPAMIADGALEKVDEIFGLHVWPLTDTGKFSICQGPVMGQPDEFEIEITGSGGHAAMPQKTVDPIVIASQFITAIQAIVARNIDPLEPAVLSVTQFHAGSALNVIPETVRIAGTVRTLHQNTRKMIRQQLEKTLAAFTGANEATYQFEYREGYPVCYNHASSAEKAFRIAKALVGETNVIYPERPFLLGEDFAYYTEKVPGCFIFLGTRNKRKDAVYMCHDPRFDIDEDCMLEGMALHAALALHYGKL